MKIGLKKTRKNEKFLRTNESDNSFLVETSFNSDIDLNIRNEIESKYQQSKINSNYIFPRVSAHQKSRSRQLSTKNSFDRIGKFCIRHKSSKSTIHSLNLLSGDSKGLEVVLSKKMGLKIPIPPKCDDKKNYFKHRGISYREIKTERNLQSKSPKNVQKMIEAYSKNGISTSRKVENTDFLSKIFTPYNPTAKLLNNAASMRLKKLIMNPQIFLLGK